MRKRPIENQQAADGPSFRSVLAEVLREQGHIIGTPAGSSMWPILRSQRDTVLLASPSGRLKRLDIALYRRRNGQAILHRVLKVRSLDYGLCGDNQWAIEYGITDEQILGVVEGIYRDEKYIPCSHPFYRLLAVTWCLSLNLRWLLLHSLQLLQRATRRTARRTTRRSTQYR
jgi:hypothetical protein